jgi:hypothetical protein
MCIAANFIKITNKPTYNTPSNIANIIHQIIWMNWIIASTADLVSQNMGISEDDCMTMIEDIRIVATTIGKGAQCMGAQQLWSQRIWTLINDTIGNGDQMAINGIYPKNKTKDTTETYRNVLNHGAYGTTLARVAPQFFSAVCGYMDRAPKDDFITVKPCGYVTKQIANVFWDILVKGHVYDFMNDPKLRDLTCHLKPIGHFQDPVVPLIDINSFIRELDMTGNQYFVTSVVFQSPGAARSLEVRYRFFHGFSVQTDLQAIFFPVPFVSWDFEMANKKIHPAVGAKRQITAVRS